jgi:hypothetical protein
MQNYKFGDQRPTVEHEPAQFNEEMYLLNPPIEPALMDC